MLQGVSVKRQLPASDTDALQFTLLSGESNAQAELDALRRRTLQQQLSFRAKSRNLRLLLYCSHREMSALRST